MKRIPLRTRDGSIRDYALVDDADFDWLSDWRWHLKQGYAATASGKVGMHRVILELDFGDPRQGEHIDRNGLNNQRSNLRIAEHGQLDNQQNVGLRSDNTSGYRGVHWSKDHQKWRAQVCLNGKKHTLGWYDAPEDADAACKAFRAEQMPFSEDATTV